MKQNSKLRWHEGRLFIDIEATIRVPVEIEPVLKTIVSDIKLTPRERQVLDGILRGYGNKEIANGLGICSSAVKFHVSHLLGKFGVRGRQELSALFTMKPDIHNEQRVN